MMNLYKITYQSVDLGARVRWAVSLAGAKKERTKLKRGDDNNIDLMYEIEIEQIDIPTDKKGLLVWLNVHYDNDNG